MCRILIVEDEKNLAAFVDKGFKKYGFKTEIAGNGKTALDVVRKTAFDVVLLD